MMNLATRCATCGTMFRVVQDQLKVSDGWVRCGHCQAVFNAVESLFDLDHGRLPVGPPDTPAAPRPDDRPRLDAALPAPLDPLDPLDPSRPPARHDADRIRIAAKAPASLNTRPVAPPVTPHRSMAPVSMSAGPPGKPAFVSAPSGLLRERSVEVADPARHPPRFAAGPAPSVRPPPSAHRLRSPALVGAAVVLVLLLGAQALVHERNLAAARWPGLRPVLAAGCAAFGCRLGLPQSIDEITVENTGLVRTALAGAFQFSVGLRNRGAVALALPSVELSLTDTNGQLVARRVLAAMDFENAPTAILPGGEAVLQALLATPSSVVSGYTVEAFYP